MALRTSVETMHGVRELQAELVGQPSGFIDPLDTNLPAVWVDKPDFTSPNLLVDPRFLGDKKTLLGRRRQEARRDDLVCVDIGERQWHRLSGDRLYWFHHAISLTSTNRPSPRLL